MIEPTGLNNVGHVTTSATGTPLSDEKPANAPLPADSFEKGAAASARQKKASPGAMNALTGKSAGAGDASKTKANSAPKGFDLTFDTTVRQFAPESVFVSPDGSKAMIFLDPFGASPTGSFADRPYLSQNVFWADLTQGRADQLKQEGYGGSSVKFDASYAGGAKVNVNDTALQFTAADGKTATFSKVDDAKAKQLLNAVKFMSLPKVSEPEYLAKLPDGRMFLVTSSKYDYQYDTCKAYIGTPGNMQNIPITGFDRYRDGGTTYVTTPEGKFYSPTPLEEKKPCTFDGQEVESVSVRKGQNSVLVASLGVDFGDGELKSPVL